MSQDDEYTPPDSVLDEEDQRRILEGPARGTWAVLGVYGILFAVMWLYFWFGLFVPAGLVR